MDTSVPDIEFDDRGVCNLCKQYHTRAQNELYYTQTGQEQFKLLLNEIKRQGEGKQYDCIIGISGGVDSTAVAYWVKKLGLRALAVHLDNGWNSELAVSNIEKTLKKLDIPLSTHVIDWQEFKDLHLSFLKASVPNSEIPTDHAIFAALYRAAAKEGVRYILSGANLVTEGIMPRSWMSWSGGDFRLVKSIHRRFGRVRLKTFPYMTLWHWVYYTFIKKIRYVPLLNYIPYNKQEAKTLIQNELGWKDYGGKHFESIYTRFFQGYILPRKFGIDKRIAHYSSLICSGQLTRADAVQLMQEEAYSAAQLVEDKAFVIKKLGLQEQEFDAILALPPKPNHAYPSNQFWFQHLRGFVQFAKRVATAR